MTKQCRHEARDKNTSHRQLSPRPGLPSVMAIMLAFILISMFIKVPLLRYPHEENDEIIYTTLAKSLLTRGTYSLQGTEILSRLSPTIYDHPIFHHPPLFPALLVPFVAADARGAAVVISWLGHALAILGVGLVIRQALQARKEPFSITELACWLPLLAVTADPLQIFVARKLWIEGIFTGLFTISAAFLLLAPESKRPRLWLTLSGLGLGMAALAKISVLALAPVYVYALHLFFHKKGWFFAACCFCLLPAAALTLPWFVYFYEKCGVFLPDWINPDQWSMEHFPLMKEWANRPWYFYLIKAPLLIPVLPLCLYCFWRDRSILKQPSARIAFLFVLCQILVLSWVGARGLGFQLRHLTLITPVIYIFLHHALPARSAERPVLVIAFVLCVFVAAVQGLMYLLAPNFDDLLLLTDYLVM